LAPVSSVPAVLHGSSSSNSSAELFFGKQPMPCLPRRTLKHDCNMAEEGETPIPDIPVGFSHKCHVAVTASDIFLAIMQATGQTWA